MYNAGIKRGIKQDIPPDKIARKIFLSYPTSVFLANPEMEYQIKNEICEKFDIPIFSIHVCGSAKTGYSFYKKRMFDKNISDLDISIINESLYIKYLGIAYSVTNRYTDLTVFQGSGRLSGTEQAKSFKNYLSRGMIRPDLLPESLAKKEWFDFFGKLSNKYIDEFKNINAGIYCNQLFFEQKQSDIIKEIKKEGTIK